MANVQKHRDRWVAVWRDQRGALHRKVADKQPNGRPANKQQTLEYAQQKEAEARRLFDASKGEQTVATYARAWIAAKIEQSKQGQLAKPRLQTLEAYKAQIEHHLCHPEIGLGGVKLKELGPPLVKQFRADLCARHLRQDEGDPQRKRQSKAGTLSTRTVNAVVTLLAGICKDAVEDGVLAANPARIRKLSEPAREIGFLGGKEIARLLTAAEREPEPFAVMVNVAVLCGVRRSELLALRWRDVDLERGVLAVREGFVKGSFSPTKTEKSRRFVGLGAQTVELLRRHRARTRELDPNGLVFDRGGQEPVGLPVDPSNFSKAVSALLKREGFAANVSLHSLRHSFASLLLEQGADLFKVSSRLGHANTLTTSGIYAHALPDSIHVEAEMMENAVLAHRGPESGSR